MENTPQSLILGKAARWLAGLYRENRLPFLSSLLFGMLAYLFAFTNKLVNHDEVWSLFSKGATVTSGRWGLGALDSIFPNYSMPWIYGVITVVLIAAAICVLLRVFAIRSRLLQVLLAGTVMVFPSLIGVFGYMFTSSSYALSFFFAILAVWFVKKPGRLFFLPALASMILSLSIYQSYISVSASLLVLLVIQQLMQEETVLPALWRGMYYVAFLILSLALYYIATQIVLHITGTQFSSYAADSISLRVTSILSSVVLAYTSFWRLLTEHYHSLVVTSLSAWMHWLLLAATGILLILWALRQKGTNPGRFLFILVLLALLPLAINCMYLITAEESIHTLVLYSFIAIYVLAAMVADQMLPQIPSGKITTLFRYAALNLVTAALAVILAVNTYIANESYLYLYLNYENSYTFYSTLFADLKMMPEFDEDTKIAIIGHKQEPDFYSYQFSFTSTLTGISGFHPNTYSQSKFMEYYLGFSIGFATAEEIEALAATPEYAQMACYPYYGSMRMIGDFLVVKLS